MIKMARHWRTWGRAGYLTNSSPPVSKSDAIMLIGCNHQPRSPHTQRPHPQAHHEGGAASSAMISGARNRLINTLILGAGPKSLAEMMNHPPAQASKSPRVHHRAGRSGGLDGAQLISATAYKAATSIGNSKTVGTVLTFCTLGQLPRRRLMHFQAMAGEHQCHAQSCCG
jgi:hypothetical protein